MDSWDKLRGKRVFLSGASGFVGTWLTESFEYANEALNLRAKLTNVPRDSLPDGYFDFGIHAAKAQNFSDDMDATRRFLKFSEERHASRILFCSSGAVYGKLPLGMTRVPEEYAGMPETEYGRAKFAGEMRFSQSKVCAVIARMFAFVGPGVPLDANFAVGNFVGDVMEGRPITIQGDGSARRSYLYAADMAIWLWTLLLNGRHATPYNVGSPQPVSIWELAHTVAENTARGTEVKVLGQGSGSVYVPFTERSRTEFELRPSISLAEGIRRMYDWNVKAKDREMMLVPATTV
jgi:nucleoside-diphosphate-sugar epimerase